MEPVWVVLVLCTDPFGREGGIVVMGCESAKVFEEENILRGTQQEAFFVSKEIEGAGLGVKGVAG